MFIGVALLAILSLKVSWVCFWGLSVVTLTAYFFSGVDTGATKPFLVRHSVIGRYQRMVVLLTALVAVLLTLWVSRSDADDAFYVGIAAFAHAHPGAALMSQDPMHGEVNWPLIFPSYRFTSYELLMAAIAQVLGIPAMDVAYCVLPPLAAGATVVATFFLAKQVAPRRWLAVGLITLILGLILGECHRGPANFMFVRMFQGKAVYLSALLPLIYALTFRYARGQQSSRDILLLACAQVAAIGISNFAMLAAPMAAGTAFAAAWVTTPKTAYRRMLPVALTLLIPVPYLLYVAIASRDGVLVVGTQDTAETVWRSVFGERQQYFIALLLLIGPAFARDTRERLWLVVPPFLLLTILLNPFLAGFISRYLTTAPVYWRVTWCLPILTYLAQSFCLIFDQAAKRFTVRNPALWMASLLVLMLFSGLHYNVLRRTNDVQWHFAGWKVAPSELTVAQDVNGLAPLGTRIVAPESVTSIIAMFEQHPRLVSVRDMYLEMLAPAIGNRDYQIRKRVLNFVSEGLATGVNDKAVSDAFAQLKVGAVVLSSAVATNASNRALLAENGFVLTKTSGNWTIWLHSAPMWRRHPL
ncbi:hypothetical protein GCM10027066_26310 [Dyella jejuensis]